MNFVSSHKEESSLFGLFYKHSKYSIQRILCIYRTNCYSMNSRHTCHLSRLSVIQVNKYMQDVDKLWHRYRNERGNMTAGTDTHTHTQKPRNTLHTDRGELFKGQE